MIQIVTELVILGGGLVAGYFYHRLKAITRARKILEKRVEAGKDLPDFNDLLYISTGKKIQDKD